MSRDSRTTTNHAAMLVLTLLWVASAARSAHGDIDVNSLADVVADDGQCTLREAIVAANGNSASGAPTG